MSEIETLENVVSMAEALERIAASPAAAALSCLPRDYWPRATADAEATIGAVTASGADVINGAATVTVTGADESNGEATSTSQATASGVVATTGAANGGYAKTGDGDEKPRYPGAEIADSIGSASRPFSWPCLPKAVQDRGQFNQLAMFDVLPPWPPHYMGRLAWTACCVAGIAHRHNAWEILDASLQALAGADDLTWTKLRMSALSFYVAGALGALGLGVDNPGAIKIIGEVTSAIPLLPWRQNFEREDGRVSWLRRELFVCDSVSVATSDLVTAWRRYTTAQGLPFDTPGKELNKMGRAVRTAFSDQIKKETVIESENLTVTQAGPCRRRRGMIGLAFRDVLLFKQICSMPS